MRIRRACNIKIMKYIIYKFYYYKLINSDFVYT
jgi:hypothetical protein